MHDNLAGKRATLFEACLLNIIDNTSLLTLEQLQCLNKQLVKQLVQICFLHKKDIHAFGNFLACWPYEEFSFKWFGLHNAAAIHFDRLWNVFSHLARLSSNVRVIDITSAQDVHNLANLKDLNDLTRSLMHLCLPGKENNNLSKDNLDEYLVVPNSNLVINTKCAQPVEIRSNVLVTRENMQVLELMFKQPVQENRFYLRPDCLHFYDVRLDALELVHKYGFQHKLKVLTIRCMLQSIKSKGYDSISNPVITRSSQIIKSLTQLEFFELSRFSSSPRMNEDSIFALFNSISSVRMRSVVLSMSAVQTIRQPLQALASNASFQRLRHLNLINNPNMLTLHHDLVLSILQRNADTLCYLNLCACGLSEALRDESAKNGLKDILEALQQMPRLELFILFRRDSDIRLLPNMELWIIEEINKIKSLRRPISWTMESSLDLVVPF